MFDFLGAHQLFFGLHKITKGLGMRNANVEKLDTGTAEAAAGQFHRGVWTIILQKICDNTK